MKSKKVDTTLSRPGQAFSTMFFIALSDRTQQQQALHQPLSAQKHGPSCQLPKRHQALNPSLVRTSLLITLSFCLGLLLAIAPLLPSLAVPVSDVPNPRQLNGTWVSDMADVLTEDSEAQLNQMITELEAQNGAEIAVVTVPDTQPSPSPKAFATELFNTWGIGKAGENNGVLFLVSKGDRRTEIETGVGLRDRLSASQITILLEQEVTPPFKAGDFDAGILAGTDAIIRHINAERSLSPPKTDYWGWIVSHSWIWVIAIAATTATQLQKLEKSLLGSLKIAPTGHSELSAASGFLQPLKFWLIKKLIGSEMLQTRGLNLASSDVNSANLNSSNLKSLFSHNITPRLGLTPADKTAADKISSSNRFDHTTAAAQENQLTAYYRNRALIKSGQTILFTLLGLSLFAVVFLKASKLELVLAAWLWLGYEVSLSSQLIAQYRANSTDGWQRLALKSFVQISLAIGLILLLLFILLSVLTFFLLPFATVALLGSCAGILRLVRSLPEGAHLECQDCSEPLCRIDSAQLQQHISAAQQMEIQLKNKSYEGWHCPNCSPIGRKEAAQIHLFSTRLNHEGYCNCDTCNALTMEIESEILTRATTRKAGVRRITKRCHCCDRHLEQEVAIPKKSGSSSNRDYLASGGYSSADYGGGSSYSGGSSGDSFGGGSSDGDGAGSDW